MLGFYLKGNFMYIVLHTANGVGFVTRVNSDEALKEHLDWLLDNAWPFSLSYGNAHLATVK
jgi:hypothetical protein